MGKAMHVSEGGIWEISIPPSQFCCEPRTPLKSKVLIKIFKYIYTYIKQNSKIYFTQIQCVEVGLYTN